MGNLLEDPSVGIIINRYEKIKSGEIKHIFIRYQEQVELNL